jgi:arabinan endo-1,5-alpha-L-arabinosidase
VDVAGNTLQDQDDHFNYGLKMMGNYTFPSLNYTYMAPGGQSTFQDDDGKYYITYHQRFDDGTEYHEPRVHQMYTNEDGWFVKCNSAGVNINENNSSIKLRGMIMMPKYPCNSG